MSWTYRISKQTLENGDEVFAIREFYPNSKGKLTSWGHEEVTPVGTTLEDLKGELALIMQCLDKEVIDIGGEDNEKMVRDV
jgi:hypothetical protein